jgi:hypothetical protein
MILYYSDKKVGVPFSLPASLVNLWNSLAFFVAGGGAFPNQVSGYLIPRAGTLCF